MKYVIFFGRFFSRIREKKFIDILKRRKLTIFFEIEYFQSFGTGYTILYVVFLTEMISLVLAKNTYRSIPGNARRKALSSLLLLKHVFDSSQTVDRHSIHSHVNEFSELSVIVVQ